MLVRFHTLHDTYCPFRLVFGACVLVLFANCTQMNRYLAWGSFLAGIVALALFLEGSVIPPYR